MAKEKSSKEKTVVDDLQTAAVQDESAKNINDGMALQQQIAEAQQEWFSRSPEENVSLLNESSKDSGVYNFSYTKDIDSLPDIPGMNKVTYTVPDDPDGGSYVGYESYEQTYNKAEQTYKDACKNGTPTAEQEQAYQDATEAYSASKNEYDMYLDDNPDAPDYLSSDNPVDSYANYEIPQTENEMKEADEQSAVEAQAKDADKSISMDDVQSAMDEGKTGTFQVNSAATSGRYADDAKASEQKFVVRMTDSVDKDTVAGVESYESTNGTELPEITAEKGTDEYGKQLVDRIKAIDDELASTDSSYESTFPSGMQYYADGENPKAIPGMTVVVGKIDGVPGYFAGYESYDKTYQETLNDLNAKSADIDAEVSKNGNSDELTAKQEENNKAYQEANDTYDYQKNQYDEYVQDNPSNDFLDEDDPVQAYESYDGQQGWTKSLKNFFVNVKEWIKDKFDKGVAFIDAKMAKEGDEFLTEDQAAQQSEDYWEKRAENEPEDEDVAQNAADAKEANDALKASKEAENEVSDTSTGTQSEVKSEVSDEQSETQSDVQATQDVQPEQFSGATSSYTPRRNVFRNIVENGTDVDNDYQVQNPMSSNENPYGYASTTGNQQLDELFYGSEDSLNMNVMNNMEDRYGDVTAKEPERGEIGSDATTKRSSSKSRVYGNQQSQSQRSALNDRAADLAARLQANSDSPSMDGPEY